MKRFSVLFAVVLLFTSVLPTDAQGFPVKPGVWRLDGFDPALAGTEDLEPLRQLVGEAPVVALGESYHTVGDFYRLKHRVFRYLVEEMGFRVFAFETNWQGAERVDRYVQTCEGDPRQLLGFLHPVWQGTEVLGLLDWMCAWNRDHPEDRISFAGFDVQGPWEDAPTLITFLGRIGIPDNHAWVAGIRSCDKVTTWYPFGQIPRESHDACIGALQAIDGHFAANAEQIVRRTSDPDFDRARLARVAMEGFQHSVYTIAHDYNAGFSVRDVAMAHVFQTLRERRYLNAKTVIWAANVHIAQNRLPRGEVPMGSHLARALGPDYVSLALTAYKTETADPPRHCGLVKRARGSVEDRLHKLGEDFLLVDLKRSSTLKRNATYWMGLDRVKARKDFDGLFYLESAAVMDSILWEPCS